MILSRALTFYEAITYALKIIFYSFLFRTQVATPIMPRNSPPTEAPHEKKFRKKVDSNTRIKIKKGMTTPRTIRIRPRPRRRRGEFIIYSLTLRTPERASGRCERRVETSTVEMRSRSVWLNPIIIFIMTCVSSTLLQVQRLHWR